MVKNYRPLLSNVQAMGTEKYFILYHAAFECKHFYIPKYAQSSA